MIGVDDGQSPAHDDAAEGHHDMVAQPHSDEEGPVAEAEILAAEMSSDEQPLGASGPPIQSTVPVLHRVGRDRPGWP